jgi:hypothetical protein
MRVCCGGFASNRRLATIRKRSRATPRFFEHGIPDPLPDNVKCRTEDSWLIGTDYSHAGQSAEIEAFGNTQKRAEKAKPASVPRKILDDKPRRFFWL